MKNILVVLVILISISSCKKEEIEMKNPDKDIPIFVGTWSRKYDILGSEFTAKYEIDTNQIHYTNKGSGPGNADYTISFDSYEQNDKRWIGHTDKNQYYLIFFKDITEDNITIYKQKVKDPNTAQTIEIPAADDDKNYGWNTYNKD